MGVTPVADLASMPAGQSGEADFRSFEVPGLASDQSVAPTGMREELLLVAWLIVLLRTREDSQVNFDWTYKSGVDHGTVARCLSMDKVMTGLQDAVGKVAAAILDDIASAEPSQHAASPNPASLLLSTSTLSHASEGTSEEGVLHVEVRLRDGQLEIRPVWHTANMLQFTVTRHVDLLAETIKACMSNPEAAIEDSLGPTARDLDDIWSWNHELPPTYDFCMQDMIHERAQATPGKVAIDSWDGSLTYAQIDQYSTFVAHSLKAAGVQLHDVVPGCFEKSRWTIVAVLAMMKAGATFALMDPTLPLARLQNMGVQVGAKVMLSSRKQHELATAILPEGTHVVVDAGAFAGFSTADALPPLDPVPASALMYIIFTSGSTGTPKGVTVSHRTYTSSAIPRAKAVGYAEDWRVLDFASYAFDVSIDSMLLTTGAGGTLCIPSDEDRLNDINAVMRDMRVNYAGVTPSVARILDTELISSLHALGLGGEAASARDVSLWGRHARIVIGYGPCECTIGCTINSSAATGRDYISIGTGNGAAIWIADPNDHGVLMPVGAVGELLVEGPIVGQGYLHDPAKTASAFIEDPAWLVAGHGAYAGRRGQRLYKTGDLGRYDPDGAGGIVFAGRKDTQVKLRGQRVELGEIESRLRASLPADASVVAEVIVPQATGGQPTLVAFVASQAAKGYTDGEISAVQLPGELRARLAAADKELARTVPRYMVPTAYVPVSHVPVLISGKTDRKRLRAFGQTVDLRQLDHGAASSAAGADRELTDVQLRLRQAWSQVLGVDAAAAAAIRADDNLFALGGDSLAAMKLVAVCRAAGLELSVAATFAHPTLAAMAGVVRIVDAAEEARTQLAPFCMVAQDVDSARLEAARACGVSDAAAVEDIYPATPTQQNLFAFSLKSPKAYVAQRVARIPAHVDLAAWKAAWEHAAAANPILRSRLAQLSVEPGLQQVVLAQSIEWNEAADLAHYLEADRHGKMELGQPLARYAIVTPADSQQRLMVWTVHHVLYDGWSEPLVLEQVRAALLAQQPLAVAAQMRDFVHWVRATDAAAMQAFWRDELAGAVGPQFPRLPSRDYLPTPSATVERRIALDTAPGPGSSPFTLATLIRGAWALVAAQHAGSDYVVFGETLTGRDVALPGVEGIVGPLIATVPVRIRIQRGTTTVASYLQAVQQGVLARSPWQHMGFQHIRRVSADAQLACETGTGLVIQPEPDAGEACGLGFDGGDVVREALHFNAYPVMLACGIQKGSGGFRVCASFDKRLVGVAQMRRMLAQLETACVQLAAGPLDRRLDALGCLPAAELDAVWRWNAAPPLGVDAELACLRADARVKPGAVYPRALVPWVCDARNPSRLAPIGCVGELWLEGACLPPGEAVEDPAWLVAGSPAYPGRRARVQATGDMVRLQEDGSLVFVRRKEGVLRIQGHAVDVADFDPLFSAHLPPSARAAAAVFQAGEQQQQQLVVFVEQPASEEDGIEILSEPHSITDHVQICASIPGSLAAALKKLDRSIQETLTSYMVPSAYIVVSSRLPTDAKTLSALASAIPHAVVAQLRAGVKEAFAQTTAQSALTPAEEILRHAWAQILGLAAPDQIDVDDNFFRLGGDSVLGMKLVARLRAQGHALSVADIFTHMRLRDAANAMRLHHHAAATPAQAPAYKPFSTLQADDVEAFVAGLARPQLADASWNVQDVYPVTDTQALDVQATLHAPRSSVQYTLLHLDGGVDAEQLARACAQLVKTHDILRTVFIAGEAAGSLLQVVLHDLDAPLATHQADGDDLAQAVTDFCTADAELDSNFALGAPFLKLALVQGTAGKSCFVLRLSHAQYDGASLPRLLDDLSTLYAGSSAIAAPSTAPFAAYIAHTARRSTAQQAALSYWRALLADSSLSLLPPASSAPAPTERGLFRSAPVAAISSRRAADATVATLLTAAWALVLARRLRVRDVVFGAVTGGRLGIEELAGVEGVVGPCYTFAPVRVRFGATVRVGELLRGVQRQSGESAGYDWVGPRRISRECTQWGEVDGWFGSVVHHQDADEDFDEMPFGKGDDKARVDICKPHGDAPTPLKVVSFVKGGVTHVGVVGRESEGELVESVLGELVGAVEELAGEGERVVVLEEVA